MYACSCIIRGGLDVRSEMERGWLQVSRRRKDPLIPMDKC